MNVHTGDVLAPPAPRSLRETGLSMVMMRDILLKTMFRQNIETVSEIARTVCLPIAVAQELVDLARDQKLVEAMGNMHATSGPEMVYQLSDAGRARALDALAQSEYYGALPVPLESYYAQTRRQSVRNIQITRQMLEGSMGHLVLPAGMLENLGPAAAPGGPSNPPASAG